MRTIFALLAMIAVVASCGGPSPSPSAATSIAPSNPSADPGPIAGASDAFVVTVGETADGTTTDDLQIEAVSPNGIRRLVATLTDSTAGLADGSRILLSEPILVSPRGLLTVAVDVAVKGVEGDVERRLIFDLRDLGRPPLVVPAVPAAWGPDGRLAIVGYSSTTFVDPARGEQVVASNPEGASISTVWAADASGLLASRLGANDLPILGIFRADGRFIDGLRTPYSTTGFGRPYGADGTMVDEAFSDGAQGSDHAIVEERPGQEPVAWIVVHEPGPDPAIFDHAWDAAGIGQWALLGREGKARLVHLAGPGEPEERATFEMTSQPRIAGVAPSGEAVVVAMDATDTAPAALLRIDTSTGVVIRIERAGGTSYFAGWAAVP